MASHVRWGRLCRIAALAVLGLVACLFAVVRTQQYVLRWRAERLLADIRQIQMGKSTWADAQKLMYKWGKWGGYEGSCTADRCDYQIALEDPLRVFPAYFASGRISIESDPCCKWMVEAYNYLGGRNAAVFARLQVKNGIVWTKEYSAAVLVLPIWPHPDVESAYELAAFANGMTGSDGSRSMEFSTDAPEYSSEEVTQWTWCEIVRSNFTPFADPLIVDRLLDFDLSCFTRWTMCKTPAELSPSMVKIAKEIHSGRATLAEREDPNAFPLEILARDYHFAATALAIGPNYPETDVNQELIDQPSFRILESLKNRAVFHSPVLRSRLVPRTWAPVPRDGAPHFVPPETKVILLFDVSPDDSGRNSFFDVVVPLTTSNMAAVKRGIDRDKLAYVP